MGCSTSVIASFLRMLQILGTIVCSLVFLIDALQDNNLIEMYMFLFNHYVPEQGKGLPFSTRDLTPLQVKISSYEHLTRQAFYFWIFDVDYLGYLCPQIDWHTSDISRPVSFHRQTGFVTNINDFVF